jgi:hypothetical protein
VCYINSTSTQFNKCELVVVHRVILLPASCDAGKNTFKFKRCECEDGLKPGFPDPKTGVIKRCIGPNEEGVLSLISQALFGQDADGSELPLKINLKLNEKAILDSCTSIVSIINHVF